MPRVKKPLVEADRHSSRMPLTAKRAKRTPSDGKEKAASELKTKTKDELVSILAERCLPHTGNKAALIARLEEHRDEEVSAQSADSVKANTATVKSSSCEDERKHEKEPETLHKATYEQFNYQAMTNNKLRALVRDRKIYESMRIYGFDEWSYYGEEKRKQVDSLSREEMLEKLLKTPINYESCTSNELSDVLRRRHSVATGTKAVKIERLRANDQLQYDTGDSSDMTCFIQLECLDRWGLPGLYAKREAFSKGDYSSFSTGELRESLQQRKLLYNGQRAALLKRLEGDNEHRRKFPPCKTTAKKIKQREAERDKVIRRLEEETGWTRDAILAYRII